MGETDVLNICFVPITTDSATKQRLVAAASELFADRGFHGTTVRDIAARARVNLAAGHYHYGSKKALYLAVFRSQFAEIRARLARGGVVTGPRELAALSRPAVVRLFRARVGVMLDLLIGPPLSLHGALMQREMMDPSEALPVIVDEFIRPLFRETEEIVARLRPDLGPTGVRNCVFSIVGQVLFFRYSMAGVLRLLDLPAYPRSFARQLADHVASFSLDGIAHLTPAPGHGAGRAAADRTRRRRGAPA